MMEDKDKIIGTNHTIQWRFLPPYASNFAGVHEVMVRAMKRALKHILTNSDISDEELVTALVKAEGLLNSRPITACEDDVQDGTCLTPNHFLIGRVDPCNILDEELKGNEGLLPSRRWKLIQSLVAQVWVRWQKEVLHGCLTRTKWKTQAPNLKVGDVVLVLEPIQLKARKWRLGRVIKTYPGYDGQVRVVDVMVDGKTFRRPVNKLCMLEC